MQVVLTQIAEREWKRGARHVQIISCQRLKRKKIGCGKTRKQGHLESLSKNSFRKRIVQTPKIATLIENERFTMPQKIILKPPTLADSEIKGFSIFLLNDL